MSSKPLIWIVITILAEMILIAVFAPPSWMTKAIDTEMRWIDDTYNEGTHAWIDNTTQASFDYIIIDTGLKDWITWLFLPEDRNYDKQRTGMNSLGDRFWFPFLESRGETLSEMVRITIMRVISIAVWLPLIMLCLIGCIVDGWMERNIKRHTFKYPSPFLYRYGARSAIFCLFMTFFFILTPIPIPPFLLPVVIMLSIVITGISVISNLPKRL